jgi:hypothetical protein
VVATRDALLVELALWGDDINVIRRHVQAAEIASGIGKAVKNAYQAIDRMADRKYLGKCNHKIEGSTATRNCGCGPTPRRSAASPAGTSTTWRIVGRTCSRWREDMIVTPREASQYIGEVGGFNVGHQRIRNYLDRKRIALRPSPDDVQRFRLGDLLTLLRDEMAQHDVRLRVDRGSLNL